MAGGGGGVGGGGRWDNCSELGPNATYVLVEGPSHDIPVQGLLRSLVVVRVIVLSGKV